MNNIELILLVKELLQSQIKAAIQTNNGMMISFNKSLTDSWFEMLPKIKNQMKMISAS
jgi:hypothetical protein